MTNLIYNLQQFVEFARPNPRNEVALGDLMDLLDGDHLDILESEHDFDDYI